jgi:phosphoribosylglycinamide formyltransferase-1
VAVVISNVPGAPALARAREAAVPAHLVDHRGRAREDHDRAMLEVLRAHDVGLVCLAGYMRLLSAEFLRAFPERILNVHPSLLPAFPGRDAVRQAFAHGVKVTGATVHLVDEGLDSGPIVLQEAVTVEDDDTEETLAARVLEAEHRLYPRAVRAIVAGEVVVDGRRVRRASRA